MQWCRRRSAEVCRRHVAMLGGLVSFVKRLFGRTMSSDESCDCHAAAAAGDCNGNTSVWRDPVTTPSTWTARRCRRHGHAVRDCRRCGGGTATLSPSDADRRRWTLSRHDAADDGVEAVCSCQYCSGGWPPCLFDDGQHPIHHPRVSTRSNYQCPQFEHWRERLGDYFGEIGKIVLD